MKIYLLIMLIGTCWPRPISPRRRSGSRRRFRNEFQIATRAIPLLTLRKRQTPLPREDLLHRLLGVPTSSVSISAGWIFVGARPPRWRAPGYRWPARWRRHERAGSRRSRNRDQRGQHLGDAVGAPDAGQRAPGFENAPRRCTQFASVVAVATCATPRAVSGDVRCRRGSLNSGSSARHRRCRAAHRCKAATSASTSAPMISATIAFAAALARRLRQQRIDLDRNQIDARDAPGDRNVRDTDAGARDRPRDTRTRRCRRRQQHGIVTGAMSD